MRQQMGKSAAKKMTPVDPLTSEVLAGQGVTTNVEPVSGAIFGSDAQPASQTIQPAPIQPGEDYQDPVTGEDAYEIQPAPGSVFGSGDSGADKRRRKRKRKPFRKGLLADSDG